MFRPLTIALLILSSSIHAEESKLKYLPKENISFEIVNQHSEKTLVKDQFETTAEFEKRRLNERNNSEPVALYKIESSLRYNADSETYYFSCYDSEKISLKNDISYVSKSGTNGFGANWEWQEKVGKMYEIFYKCPTNKLVEIQVPIEDAKRYRDDFIAVLEIKLEPKNWSSRGEFDTPEFGKSYVNKYQVFYKEGSIEAIHYGFKSKNSVYQTKTFDIEKIKNDKIVNNPIVKIKHKYPAQAARDGQEGWVRLSFTINEVGGVDDVTVTEAKPKRVFDREAKRALSKWKYKPLIQNGKPVKQHDMTIKLNFNLDKD